MSENREGEKRVAYFGQALFVFTLPLPAPVANFLFFLAG